MLSLSSQLTFLFLFLSPFLFLPYSLPLFFPPPLPPLYLPSLPLSLLSSNAGLNPKVAVSVATLAFLTISACFVTEHELGPLLGVVGAIFGGGVVYVLPAVWNIKVAEKMPLFRREKEFNYGLGIFGVLLMVLGSYVSIQ